MRSPPGARAASLGLWCAVAILASPALFGQGVIRQGSEFQVNSYTFSYQHFAKVALDADGDFVLTWSSSAQDGSQTGVFARRFSSAGVAQALEFQVNSYTTNVQGRSVVAAESNGDFVIVWQSFTQDGAGGYGVFGRRFNSAGTALAVEFQVNAYTTYYQWRAAVASDSDGDFVVAWEGDVQDGASEGIFAQRFNSSGAAVGAEFQVNSHTFIQQYRPAVAVDSDGDFVIAWDSFNDHDGQGSGVFAQRFNSAGTRLGNEFQVNTYTTDSQNNPTVAAESDGDFVVAWQSIPQDGNLYGIFARRWSSSGVAQGVELRINVFTTGQQRNASIVADSSGNFVVTWESQLQDGSYSGVFARRFSPAGVPRGTEFQVNSYTEDEQTLPAAALDSDGDFVIVWQSELQDGSTTGVFAQRFSPPPLATLDIDGDGTLTALTDGLLVLRHFFGFSGATLTTGATGPNCTRCDSGSISFYVTNLGTALDIDNNGSITALTDGLLVLRFLFGFTGTTLTTGAVAQNCVTRCDAATILPYLQTLD